MEDSRLIGGLCYAWRKKIDLFSSEHNVVDSSAITMGSFRARTHANSYCSCLHVALLEWSGVECSGVRGPLKLHGGREEKLTSLKQKLTSFKVLYVLSPL